MAIGTRIKKVWNTFWAQDQERARPDYTPTPTSPSVYQAEILDRPRLGASVMGDRTIVTSILTRMAVDAASIDIRHVRLDDQGRFEEEMDSHLNKTLTLAPNLDQAPRAFRQDIAMTMFSSGVAAIVPVETDVDPTKELRFDIHQLRVGEIVDWHAEHVRVSVYNQRKGKREEVLLPKRMVAVVPNPLYPVMNAPNSTLQRLIRKLQLLDVIDEQSGSGKLDLIIQLPYSIKSEARKKQANQRKEEIEFQLRGSKYGIAYTDGSEKITQLNRPAENNLLEQVEYLTKKLYEQLGITEEVMNGKASDEVMTNYMVRSIGPVLQSIAESMQMAFLGLAGARRNERIMFFRDPFSLVPVGQLAEIADKLARNEVVTGNELRGALGLRPSKDPKADKLVNSNMPQPTNET